MSAKFDFDKIYTDQAIYRTTFLDRSFMAAYTPEGIRRIDSKYCKLIQNMPTKEYADKLRKEIKNNPHLHDVIKENLLLNLKNYRKLIGPESYARWQKIEDAKPYKGRMVEILVGENKGIIGTVTWFDEGSVGIGRVRVTSEDLKFWTFHGDKEAYYDRSEVKVIYSSSK